LHLEERRVFIQQPSIRVPYDLDFLLTIPKGTVKSVEGREEKDWQVKGERLKECGEDACTSAETKR
jgi:hypothetical protein